MYGPERPKLCSARSKRANIAWSVDVLPDRERRDPMLDRRLRGLPAAQNASPQPTRPLLAVTRTSRQSSVARAAWPAEERRSAPR